MCAGGGPILRVPPPPATQENPFDPKCPQRQCPWPLRQTLVSRPRLGLAPPRADGLVLHMLLCYLLSSSETCMFRRFTHLYYSVVLLRLRFGRPLRRTGVDLGWARVPLPGLLSFSCFLQIPPSSPAVSRVGYGFVLDSEITKIFSYMFSPKSVRFRFGIWVRDPFLFTFCVGWESRSRLGEFMFFTKSEKFGPRFRQVLFLAPISPCLLGPHWRNVPPSGVAPWDLETPFRFPVFVPGVGLSEAVISPDPSAGPAPSLLHLALETIPRTFSLRCCVVSATTFHLDIFQFLFLCREILSSCSFPDCSP